MIKHVTEREMALEAELAALKHEDRHIRRLLCVAVSDRPYMDDGEANGDGIDFLRETPEAIESKMYARNLKKFNADLLSRARVNGVTDWSAA